MKIYLAHNFDAGPHLRDTIVPFYELHGHIITSRWVKSWEGHSEKDNSQKNAVEDLEDIEEAGAIIFFATNFGDKPGRGKYVELGYALRAGKICIVMDAKLNPGCVFYSLPNIRHCNYLTETLKYLISS